MYRSSKLIKNMTTSKGKQIAVEYVTKTDTWDRKFLADSTQQEFAAVAEKYKDDLKSSTVKLAMKEAEHPSQNDYYSVFELDEDNKVIGSQHNYK